MEDEWSDSWVAADSVTVRWWSAHFLAGLVSFLQFVSVASSRCEDTHVDVFWFHLGQSGNADGNTIHGAHGLHSDPAVPLFGVGILQRRHMQQLRSRSFVHEMSLRAWC